VSRERVDRGDLHVVAATDREDERVTGDVVLGVGAHDDVGGRVVGVGVHRIRTVEFEGGGEADVPGVNADDGAHDVLSRAMPSLDI
jgi:hypothetical protein